MAACNACFILNWREGLGVGKGRSTDTSNPHVQTTNTLFCQRKASIHQKRLELAFLVASLYELPVQNIYHNNAVLHNYERV